MSGGFPGHDGFQDTTPEEFAAMSEVRFTAGVVDAIVSQFPRSASMRAQLRARVRKANPDAWPTFYDFYDEFPHSRLPLYLFVRKLPKVQTEMTLTALVNKPEKMKAVKEFLQLHDELPEDWGGSYGLVLFWPYLKKRTQYGGAMVIHNGPPYEEVGGFFSRISTDEDRVAYFEPFSRVLEAWRSQGIFSS